MTSNEAADVELTPTDLRIREAAQFLVDNMTPERRAECELLAQLEPGMRAHFLSDEWVEFSWCGVAIGAVSRHWINTGEGPLTADSSAT